MGSVEVRNNVFWVGAVDWNIRHFHGFTYSTHRGTTYNAYLVVDEKTALIDTVYRPFAGEMLDKIGEVIDPATIDYVVANHVESDHSGAIAEVLKVAPHATVVGTARCRRGLQKHYFGDWTFQEVATGDEIRLGERRLHFLQAPMLHWPDSMFTYIPEEALLLPNDAFGQHLATSKRFDDEVDPHVLMEEATKYYANILWPFSQLVIRKIEELQKLGLRIDMIAPSHGIIWRGNPMTIVEAYLKWARGEAQRRILVVYDTMWGSTETMAKAIVEGISKTGMDVRLFRLPFSDRGDILKELLDAKGLVVGSSTINNGILPTVAPFLEELVGLKPTKKVAAVFGSYGWGGGAAKTIEEKLKAAGLEIVAPSVTAQWVPDEGELEKCIALGEAIAATVQDRL